MQLGKSVENLIRAAPLLKEAAASRNFSVLRSLLGRGRCSRRAR
ncbi:MAG: hypothetical protein ACYC8T_05525 [Myxococcaceae bacterium]